MGEQMIISDRSFDYEIKEAVIIVLAIAFVLVMGGLAVVALATCGWGKVQSASMDWGHGTANIVCR